MFAVHIHNAQEAVAIDETFLREVVVHTLQTENVEHAEVSVAIVDDAAIHGLNRRFLDHDEPTDVLSFALDDAEPAGSRGFDKSLGSSSKQIDGEIVLSAETARRRGAEFGWSPTDEIVLYLVHGLLHLAGHDDQTPEDRIAMRTRERAVLAHWGLSPRYDEPPAADGGHSGAAGSPCPSTGDVP
jgi:probable rRNA maturation factor